MTVSSIPHHHMQLQGCPAPLYMAATVSSCECRAHLKLLIDEADPRELEPLCCDAHLAVDAKQVWLLLIPIRACKGWAHCSI